MTSYYSDECLAMWLLTIAGEDYYFVCSAYHPLGALQFILADDRMDAAIDNLHDATLDPSDWKLRVMGAGEEFSVEGDKDVGPFKMDDEGYWKGTVKQAVDLCGADNWVICSSAWLD